MFMILPMGVDYRARRYPVVTFTLMGICTAVYLITLICQFSVGFHEVNAWVFEHLWLTPDESHWWTYLTSQFVHGGFFHLAGNMIYLFLFGACVEDIIGRWRFTIFYLLCGIAAAFAHILMSADHFASNIPLGGASGAISGCIGGFLLLLMKTKINFKWFIFFLFRFWNGEFSLPAWLVISFWFLEDVARLIIGRMQETGGGGVAFGAHVGGTLVGMAFMAFEKVRLNKIGDDYLEEEAVEIPVARPAAVSTVVAAPRVRQKTVFIVGEKATIHLFLNGGQTGPFKNSKIQEMFANGEIPADAFYWKEGMEDWRAVEELRQPQES